MNFVPAKNAGFPSYVNLPEGRFYQPEAITNHSEMEVMFTKLANELGHHLHRNVAHLKIVSNISIFFFWELV